MEINTQTPLITEKVLAQKKKKKLNNQYQKKISQ